MTAPSASSQVDDVAAWFARVRDLKQRMLDAVKDVAPPDSMTSIHDEFVLATSEWVALGGRVVDLLADAGPDFNIGRDLTNHPELGIAPANRLNERGKAACASIERLAADNGIEVDLACNAVFK